MFDYMIYFYINNELHTKVYATETVDEDLLYDEVLYYLQDYYENKYTIKIDCIIPIIDRAVDVENFSCNNIFY